MNMIQTCWGVSVSLRALNMCSILPLNRLKAARPVHMCEQSNFDILLASSCLAYEMTTRRKVRHCYWQTATSSCFFLTPNPSYFCRANPHVVFIDILVHIKFVQCETNTKITTQILTGANKQHVWQRPQWEQIDSELKPCCIFKVMQPIVVTILLQQHHLLPLFHSATIPVVLRRIQELNLELCSGGR